MSDAENNKPEENKSVDKPRKLTAAEQKRVDAFAVTEAKLKEQGYTRKDITISITKANIIGPLLVLPIMVVFCILFYVINGLAPLKALKESNSYWTFIFLILACLSMIPLAVIHELIHGLCWGVFAKNHMKDIEYGFIVQQITPYCYCRSPLSKGAYIFGSMMPMTILGGGLCIVGIMIANPIVMVVGLIQLVGGAGDILITSMLIRYNGKGKDSILMDHPTDCGLIVFEK